MANEAFLATIAAPFPLTSTSNLVAPHRSRARSAAEAALRACCVAVLPLQGLSHAVAAGVAACLLPRAFLAAFASHQTRSVACTHARLPEGASARLRGAPRSLDEPRGLSSSSWIRHPLLRFFASRHPSSCPGGPRASSRSAASRRPPPPPRRSRRARSMEPKTTSMLFCDLEDTMLLRARNEEKGMDGGRRSFRRVRSRSGRYPQASRYRTEGFAGSMARKPLSRVGLRVSARKPQRRRTSSAEAPPEHAEPQWGAAERCGKPRPPEPPRASIA